VCRDKSAVNDPARAARGSFRVEKDCLSDGALPSRTFFPWPDGALKEARTIRQPAAASTSQTVYESSNLRGAAQRVAQHGSVP